MAPDTSLTATRLLLWANVGAVTAIIISKAEISRPACRNHPKSFR
jgi:hypothetical protein